MKTKSGLAIALLLLASLGYVGCARKAASGSRAFAQAPAEIQQLWNEALAADQTNGYVAAVTGYHRLMAQKAQLTDEQITALNAAALAINQRLYAAANSGDTAAQAASATLAGMQNRR
jgi:hypothetical protein